LFGSLVVSAHPPGHWTCGGAQLPVHAPPWHVRPTPQTKPHFPQLFGSLVTSTHALPHWTCPAGQPAGTQTPVALQTWPEGHPGATILQLPPKQAPVAQGTPVAQAAPSGWPAHGPVGAV
jgi:hypothetical protein